VAAAKNETQDEIELDVWRTARSRYRLAEFRADFGLHRDPATGHGLSGRIPKILKNCLCKSKFTLTLPFVRPLGSVLTVPSFVPTTRLYQVRWSATQPLESLAGKGHL
jgi:hypothetical protein